MAFETKKLTEAFPTFKIEQSLEACADKISVIKITVNNRLSKASLNVQLEEQIDRRSMDEIVYALQKQIFDQCGLSVCLQVLSQVNEPESRQIQEPLGHDSTPEEISHNESPFDYLQGMSSEADLEAQATAFAEYEAAYEKELEEIRRQAAEALSASEKPKSSSANSEGTQKKYRAKFAPKDENVIFGREKELSLTKLEDITEPIGEVSVQGQIFAMEERLLKSGDKYLVSMSIYDGTDSIVCKSFFRDEQWNELKEVIKEGMFVAIQGKAETDYYDKSLCISGVSSIKKTDSFVQKRKDNAKVKRVELHCHTKMSEHDGVADASAIIQRAVDWGHDAIAITDHGVVHAFTDVLKYIGKKKIDNVKPIYGLEGYLVDDIKKICTKTKEHTIDEDVVVYSLYTTGATSKTQELFEIGAVKLKSGNVSETFHGFIRTEKDIPGHIVEDYLLPMGSDSNAKPAREVLEAFLAFVGDSVTVTQTLNNDIDYLGQCLEACGLSDDVPVVDLTAVARMYLPELRGYKLDQMTKNLGLQIVSHVRANEEAQALAKVYSRLIEMAKKDGIVKFSDLNARGQKSENSIKKSARYHIILLAANEEGRSNLYRMVSASHLDYYNNVPRIPKSFIMQHREGVIVGSACEAGELMRAILQGKNDRKLKEIAEFYDYLEVQPIANNAFMLRDKKYGMSSVEDLRDLNRKVVELGELLNKPVVATCDAHFVDPEDEIYRKIIQASRGFSDVDESTPLYLRTTDEMLEEFSYLGYDKAYEIVVENTRKIADSIKKISPVRPDKAAPVIEGAEEDLRRICYETARGMYGEELPEQVSTRLEKELTSIISNGYASLYIIAHKLVKNSNEHGYLVGSRGSVGSSFVATMAGISEVNPLAPHYYCTSCQYYDFDSDDVKAIGSGSGCDLPAKKCPKCGAELKKDGFSIPFETFLGFKGDKEPDIDLNFSGEYQTQAHEYTEVIFGKGHTFKAGTIATVAEKTGFMYAKDYYESRGIEKRQCELTRISRELVGVRRSTGQHPGGIVVLPKGEEIHTFTPVQHPANDTETSIVTTHFDYHSIEHNLLKLDILGKDDPTVVRIMQDATGVDPETIPIDDPKIMSLFQNTSALGITPDDLGGCPLGCLGIPEFGTDFVIQMLLDTKPKAISDLVRISGLSHGTDVWLNNAQTLIKDGKTTLEGAICTRDDIMLYLINKGIEPAEAFTIMESVRKGRGLKPEWEKTMEEHDVPDWYIWSCKMIKYMFPKAHAAAYVMMACRIAYYKIYYPLAYYSSYLAIRGTGFKYGSMAFGRSRLEQHFKEMEKKAKEVKLTATDQEEIRDMKIVREMYARGFEFAPIDIYTAKADRFTIMDDKSIMPSLASIDGMGEKAAAAIEKEAKKGKFLSKEDMLNRCKISKTVVETMDNLGLLNGLADTNQLSIFDF